MSDTQGADRWLGRLASVDWGQDVWRDAELGHHAWFAVLALAHRRTGCLSYGVSAGLNLESWLNRESTNMRLDPEAVASRFLSWSVGVPLLAPTLKPVLVDRILDALEEQGEWLRGQRLVGAAAVRPLAALVACDLSFPGRDSPRRWWSEALTRLGREMPRLVRPDGTPVPAARARFVPLLEAWEIARTCCVREGVGIPSGLEASRRCAQAYLCAMEEGKWGEREWGVSSLLSGGWREEGQGTEMVGAGTWNLHAFREGGEVVAYSRAREQVMRLFMWVSDGRWTGRSHGLTWGLEGLSILYEPALGAVQGGWKAGEILSARVDGRQVQVVTEPRTWRGIAGKRVVHLEGTRLRITDRARRAQNAYSAWWHFGGAWSDWREASGRWHACSGEHSLEVKPDQSLAWRLCPRQDGGTALVGAGEVVAGQAVRMSVELR